MVDEPKITIEVRATVILRIPNLDTNELTKLHAAIQNIIAQFGGEFDITTSVQSTPVQAA